MEEKGILEAFYRLVVKDRDGEIVRDTGEQRSHSFVVQFLEAFYAMCADTIHELTGKDGNGFNWAAQNPIRFDAPADSDETAIFIGTGIAAESNSDYCLAARIAQGTGAGQMDYGTQEFVVPGIVGANVDFQMYRTFLNSSGSSITVNEIGMADRIYEALMIRDKLASGVAVADNQTLTVTYTLRTTV